GTGGGGNGTTVAPLIVLSCPVASGSGPGYGTDTFRESPTMDFRWVAAIALWTFLSAPIFGPATSSTTPERPRTVRQTTSGSASPAKNASAPRPGGFLANCK